MEFLTPLLSATPLPMESWHTLIRKLAHMTEFALLGLCWTGALVSGGPGKETAIGARFCPVLLVCLVTALVDETIQIFVPGRGSLVSDVWIDALGGLIGMGIALLIWNRRCRRKTQNSTQGRD